MIPAAASPAALAAPTTVIVVSRGRPDLLRLCLTALSYQYHPNFEIVLVADPAGLTERPDLAIKRVGFDLPNISEARNLGIAQAAGSVIAFIDDDAIAEPNWLLRLAQPFADPDVMAATGWTRDGDGFRWQSRTQRITPQGLTRDLLPANPDQTLLLAPDGPDAVSTLGTNCAFRATALRQIGGFDPVFPYHLDESDVNMRMGAAFPRGLTAVVPDAQVIHARAASTQRNAARVPTDLTVQGRSAALFARRHGGASADAIQPRIRRQMIRAMLEGRIDPFKVGPVLDTLGSGLRAGQSQSLGDPPVPRTDAPVAFCRMSGPTHDSAVIGGWQWHAHVYRHDAAYLLSLGLIPTVILFTPSFLPHRVRLTEGGWFEQTGGIWGPSEPGDSPVTLSSMRNRLSREAKLAKRRRNLWVSAGVSAPRLSKFGSCG